MQKINYYFTKRGFQVFIYNKKCNQQKARIIGSPEFIQLLNIITDSTEDFDNELWNKLSQIEKNFLYKIDQLCIPYEKKNKKLELVHLKEGNNLIHRLKLLEGIISAGNLGSEVINETSDIIKELINRHYITNPVGTKMINKIKRMKNEIDETNEINETNETDN